MAKNKGGTIMNYDNMTAVKCEDEGIKPDEMPLAQTLNDATLMASDVLQMVYAINQHLFGKGSIQSEVKEPKCFRDALKIHADLIRWVAEEMRAICDSLGV